MLGGSGQGDEGVGLAAAKNGVESDDGRPVAGRAVAETTKDAAGYTAHGVGGVGPGKELCGAIGGFDFAVERPMQVGGVVLTGLLQ